MYPHAPLIEAFCFEQGEGESHMPAKKRADTAVVDVSDRLNPTTIDAMLAPAASAPAVEAEQLSLFELAPWADDMRAIPNDLARSALFTVRNKKQKREAVEGRPIFHVNRDVTITFTGIELRADDDELVWNQVLEYAKRLPLGAPVQFSLYQLCKDLGWHINSRYYKRAEASLTRLMTGVMQFQSERIGRLKSLKLIDEFDVYDRGTNRAYCQVKIPVLIGTLFKGNHYSKFVWEKYRELSPIARRMFDYAVSHKNPYPLKLETFRQMCASETSRAAKWKEQSKDACQELTDSQLLKLASVQGDEIHFDR